MKKFIGTLAAAATLAAGSAALTTPVAQAVTISGSGVKYVFCSSNQHNNQISYYDRYGKVSKIVNLTTKAQDNSYCGVIEVSIEPDSYVSALIENDRAHYAYVAVYSVSYPLFSGSTGAPPNYTLVARDENRSSSGRYNYAFAY
ncbi:hypothetical protein SAMN02745947_04687 [Rhodococcus rhodochrous J3]|uniref:Uncharacterized protein n=1 Tax=Rhodococcus rhodochrous J3 TaxID=903528 RepID=A0ABY1MGW5_RHORH|nr:hypothetical protein [Rhodococcus rhodochrous]SMG55829.1 hypothetical protein SAMN02745947_04687 [Rhodococcus rhodochrous J3]